MCVHLCTGLHVDSGPPSSKRQHIEHGSASKDMEEDQEGEDEHEWFSSEDCTICRVVTHQVGIRTRPKKLVMCCQLSHSLSTHCIKLTVPTIRENAIFRDVCVHMYGLVLQTMFFE